MARGLAVRALRDDPANGGVAWAATRADVEATAAARTLAAGKPRIAKAAALRVLAGDPLDSVAVRTEALASLALGDADHALDRMELAGRLGWRDVETQRWIVGYALGAGDQAGAMQRVDALIRQATQPLPLFRGLGQGLDDPAFRSALATTLERRPPWRAAFFQSLRSLPASRDTVTLALARTMEAGEAPLTEREAALLIGGPSARRQDRTAWAMLHGIRAARAIVAEPLLRDHGFARAAQQPLGVESNAFAWTINREGAALLPGDVGAPGTDWALSLDRSLGTQPLASQILVLDPGGYNLTQRLRADTGASESIVRLACREGKPILERRAPATTDWRLDAVRFTVPPSCPSQILTVMLPADASSLSIADMAITRASSLPESERGR